MLRQFVISDTQLAAGLATIAECLAPRSRETYANDARRFAQWLSKEDLDLAALTRSDFIRYRQYLADQYADATAARMLSVARRLLKEAINSGILETNPTKDVAGLKVNNKTHNTCLNAMQARNLLDAIDRSTARGKRDYALLMLLLRTGVRRCEVAELSVNDVNVPEGSQVLMIRHGKRRLTKIPIEAMQAISDYLIACDRIGVEATEPLFVRFRKGDHPTREALSVKGIENVVMEHAKIIGLALTPHDCRASFVALALEGGANIQQIQYSVGHANLRTTERYQKDDPNFDHNVVDYVRF